MLLQRLFTTLVMEEVQSRAEKKIATKHNNTPLSILSSKKNLRQMVTGFQKSTVYFSSDTEDIFLARKMQQRKGKMHRLTSQIESREEATLLPMLEKRAPINSGKYFGFMCPSGISLRHPIAMLLLQHAEKGCKVNCSKDWSHEKIKFQKDSSW